MLRAPTIRYGEYMNPLAHCKVRKQKMQYCCNTQTNVTSDSEWHEGIVHYIVAIGS